MGRRSEFTPAQKRYAVLAVLTKRRTVSEVCRELGVSERACPLAGEGAGRDGAGAGRQGRAFEP
jgi:transposase-like protein